MGTSYKRQMILQITGFMGEDAIEKGSLALQELFARNVGAARKEEASPIISIATAMDDPTHVRDMLRKLGPQSRLYLRGHGDGHQQKLGGMRASGLAGLLGRDFSVERISVTGCQLGMPAGAAEGARVEHSMKSFAGELFTLLGPKCVNSMTARWYYLSVNAAGAKSTSTKLDAANRAIDPERKRKESKVLYFWSGGIADCRWYKYGVDDKGSQDVREDRLEAGVAAIAGGGGGMSGAMPDFW